MFDRVTRFLPGDESPRSRMRPWLVRLHRWLGISTAVFLFLAGLTGAIIAWDHELDAWLNPDFYLAQSRSAAPSRSRSRSQPQPQPPLLSPLILADKIEAADPRVLVSYLPLAIEPGHTLQVGVMGRTNPATGQPFALDFNQLAVDPATGAIQSRREWGAFSLARLELIPFIYKFHYSLFLPMKSGIDFGAWVMGVVGIAWLADTLIAIVLAFPSVKSWRKSFAFRVRRGGYALTFDLHRSGGVWVWALLMIVAVTSISMNLANPVVRPLVALFSPLAATPYTTMDGARPAPPPGADLSRERVLGIARDAALRNGITAPPGGLLYTPSLNSVAVGYFAPGQDHGDAGLGNAWLFWDARTGVLTGTSIPGRGSAGDIFMQAQFPLHSGRIIGLTGRIMVSALGVIIAMLSATGLLIWLKKSRARRRAPSPAKTSRQRGAVL